MGGAATVTVACSTCGTIRPFPEAAAAGWRFPANADLEVPATLDPVCTPCTSKLDPACEAADHRFCRNCGYLYPNDAYDYRGWDADGANCWCCYCTTYGFF
jgi:hypothetical protein